MTKVADNLNPHVYEKGSERQVTSTDLDEDVIDEIDEREIFDIIRNINDPEHPLTLEDLRVLEEKNITVNNKENTVHVNFTPTIPHCSMATLIGLSIRVQLLRALPSRFKVTVTVTEGTHASEHAVNKQLADKERVAAALENNNLVQIINQLTEGTHASEHAVNKQLADKERVAAALENNNLVQIINQCVSPLST